MNVYSGMYQATVAVNILYLQEIVKAPLLERAGEDRLMKIHQPYGCNFNDPNQLKISLKKSLIATHDLFAAVSLKIKPISVLCAWGLVNA